MIKEPGGTALGIAGFMQVLCNCGFPVPLMVPFVGGDSLNTKCPKCETEFVCARVNYDAQQGMMKLGVGFKVKAIQPGTVDDLRELDKHAGRRTN
jgi:hypothetical protein